MKAIRYTWQPADGWSPHTPIVAIDSCAESGELLYEIVGFYTAAELAQIGRLLANAEKTAIGETLSAQDWANMQASAGTLAEVPDGA